MVCEREWLLDVFSHNLSILMSENNVRNMDLALQVDVQRPTVSEWRNGKKLPSTQKLVEVARRFNVSIDSLLSTKFTVIKG